MTLHWWCTLESTVRGCPVLKACKYHDKRQHIIELFPLANVSKSSTDLIVIRSLVFLVTQRSDDSVCVPQDARWWPALCEEAPKRLHAVHKGAEGQRGSWAQEARERRRECVPGTSCESGAPSELGKSPHVLHVSKPRRMFQHSDQVLFVRSGHPSIGSTRPNI